MNKKEERSKEGRRKWNAIKMLSPATLFFNAKKKQRRKDAKEEGRRKKEEEGGRRRRKEEEGRRKKEEEEGREGRRRKIECH